MRTKLIRIGNSQGVRLSKALLQEAGLGNDLEITATPGTLTITAAHHPRAGWAQAVVTAGEELLLDAPTPTAFDAEEWEW